jgi:3-oxoacyl-[acyl-carrier-protein] synthase II
LQRFAAREAIAQAGLVITEQNSRRIGVIVSSAIGGLNTITETVRLIDREGPRRISPFAIPMLMSNGAAGLVAIDYGFKGPCFSVVSACASGIDAIGNAWMLLRSGVIGVRLRSIRSYHLRYRDRGIRPAGRDVPPE